STLRLYRYPWITKEERIYFGFAMATEGFIGSSLHAPHTGTVTDTYRSHNHSQNAPVPQKVRWSRSEAGEPWITIDEPGTPFIPWSLLQVEIQEELLPRIFSLPQGCVAV